MRIQGDYVTICSFWPLKRSGLERPSSETDPTGGSTQYEIPAYTLEDKNAKRPPKILKVYDSWQAKLEATTRTHQSADLVKVQDRASDIILHWNQRHREVSRGSLGIWIGSIDEPQFSSPECRAQMASMLDYMGGLYSIGQKLAEEHKPHLIGEDVRMAGRWLNKQDPWVDNMYSDSFNNCPICGGAVKESVFVCPHCRFVIKALPAELAKLQPQAVVRS